MQPRPGQLTVWRDGWKDGTISRLRERKSDRGRERQRETASERERERVIERENELCNPYYMLP
jgi:hypothetical protein